MRRRRRQESGPRGENECRLHSLATASGSSFMICSETVLHQELQLRHPWSSCAVLSRGLRFGNRRLLLASILL